MQGSLSNDRWAHGGGRGTWLRFLHGLQGWGRLDRGDTCPLGFRMSSDLDVPGGQPTNLGGHMAVIREIRPSPQSMSSRTLIANPLASPIMRISMPFSLAFSIRARRSS